MNKTLERIFDECQRSFVPHAKSVIVMSNLRKSSESEFDETFLRFADFVLTRFKRDLSVERLITLFAQFTQANESFLPVIIKHMAMRSTSSAKSARFRSVQILTTILEKLPDDYEIEDEEWSTIASVLLIRAEDKISAVRVHAIRGLERLQEPENQEDPVSRCLLNHLFSDPSKSVREASLTTLAVSARTKPHILKRVRDVSPYIRACVFSVLSQKTTIRHLTIDERLQVLKYGLRDSAPMVRAEAEKMLCDAWLEKCLEGDLIQLVESLDCANSEDTVSLVIRSILDQSQDKDKTDPTRLSNLKKSIAGAFEKVESQIRNNGNSLSEEIVFFWRNYVQHISKRGDDEQDSIIPALTDLCALLRAQLRGDVTALLGEDDDDDEEIARRSFVVKQLIEIGMCADARHDEIGRRTFSNLLRDLLVSPSCTAEGHVPLIVRAMAELFESEHEYLRYFVELISDIRDQDVEDEEDENADTKGEKIQDRLAMFDEDDDEEDTFWRQTRSLAIAEFLLKHTKRNLQDAAPEIKELLSSLILPCAQSEDPASREASVRCLAMYCMLDADVAENYMEVFLQFASADVPAIRYVALRAVFDLFMVHNTNGTFMKTEDKARKAIQTMMSYIDANSEETDINVRCIVAEGLGKLMMFRRLHDFFCETTLRLLRQLIFVCFENKNKKEEEVEKDDIETDDEDDEIDVPESKCLHRRLGLCFHNVAKTQSGLRLLLATARPAIRASLMGTCRKGKEISIEKTSPEDVVNMLLALAINSGVAADYATMEIASTAMEEVVAIPKELYTSAKTRNVLRSVCKDAISHATSTSSSTTRRFRTLLQLLKGECDEWTKPAFVTKGLVSVVEKSQLEWKDEEIDEDEDDPAEDEELFETMKSARSMYKSNDYSGKKQEAVLRSMENLNVV